MMLLEVFGLTKHFGGVTALDRVDMSVPSGSIVGLIGPNGAGKTTLFNLLTGFARPYAGRVILSGSRVEGFSPPQLTRHGLARTFQNIRLFPSMTALGNVMVGRHARTRSELWAALWRTRAFFEEEREIRQSALSCLRFVGLERQARVVAGSLSYGEQRRLEVARALATEPRLLLLDEPTAGMNPVEADGMIALIRRLRSEGITVLLIEHAMRVVMNLSDRVVVLDHGKKLAEGTPQEVARMPAVIEAYLGRGDSHA